MNNTEHCRYIRMASILCVLGHCNPRFLYPNRQEWTGNKRLFYIESTNHIPFTQSCHVACSLKLYPTRRRHYNQILNKTNLGFGLDANSESNGSDWLGNDILKPAYTCVLCRRALNQLGNHPGEQLSIIDWARSRRLKC